ncbi:uncharacterized protein [Medicago truncatula]|uniref:uncharacterized protein n=1 Tax=Medicago truncatula TaxID=3880 RepID=UPI001967ECA2|nr:uncharacterized protein LOC120580489 [Medicago truncatula]
MQLYSQDKTMQLQSLLDAEGSKRTHMIELLESLGGSPFGQNVSHFAFRVVLPLLPNERDWESILMSSTSQVRRVLDNCGGYLGEVENHLTDEMIRVNTYEAQQILNIPLSWRLPPDKLIWHWEKEGKFCKVSLLHSFYLKKETEAALKHPHPEIKSCGRRSEGKSAQLCQIKPYRG